jgi:hypothetical protein
MPVTNDEFGLMPVTFLRLPILSMQRLKASQ